MICQNCMSLEGLVAKLKSENASLRGKLKNTPTQDIRNIRAEVQELKSMQANTHALVASINGRVK